MARGYNLNRYRNFGIIAHIDAGKTTTSERVCIILVDLTKLVKFMMVMLLWIGWSKNKNGYYNTSAATTCFWTRTEDGKDFDKYYGSTEDEAKFRFNIIDTPGHVDFTIEVRDLLLF